MFHDVHKVDFKGWCQIKSVSESAAISTSSLYANLAKPAKLAKFTEGGHRSSQVTSPKFTKKINAAKSIKPSGEIKLEGINWQSAQENKWRKAEQPRS